MIVLQKSKMTYAKTNRMFSQQSFTRLSNSSTQRKQKRKRVRERKQDHLIENCRNENN